MPIATRILKLRRPDGEVEVPVRLFAPEQVGTHWRCRYEIDWPDRRKSVAAAGTDSVQALILALQMIGAELYTSEYHKAGELAGERSGQGYGFPVTHNLRDLLEGEDAKSF